MIQHTNPILESFSLYGGYLNEEGILHLMRNNLKSLELTNLRLYTDTDRDTLIRYMYRLRELENLQLANLTPRLHMNSFNEIFEKFQEQTPGLFVNMKRLCFNIKQDPPEHFYALSFFPNLVSLEIFYTVEKGFGSVAELIKSINMHRENHTCNPAIIIFKEYLAKKISQYNESERNRLKHRSANFRERIIDQNTKYVSVRTLLIHDL